MGIGNQLLEYLYLKKRDPKITRSSWTKYMHGMNRISLIIFIIGLLVMIARSIFSIKK